jgi:mannan endo-1,4-beta-mannosidase
LFVLLLFLCGCETLPVSRSAIPDRVKAGNYTGTAIGAYVDGLGNLAAFQASIGKNLAVVLWYVPWTEPFPAADAATVNANGSVPLITWEPAIAGHAGTLEAIAAGSYEAYVRSFLQAAKDWGRPVLLRFAHEMNGNWYPWDGVHNGGTEGAARYKRAWKYIYNVRESVGAGNVSLVWCPNNTDQPGDLWNNLAAYFPGDQYVDWVGMDGYNWGGTAWQSFDAVFSDAYSVLTALSAKPLMIGEFACAEEGGDKAAWISDAFLKMRTGYPRVKLFCWFNINKERDWRTNSSASAEAAFKNSLQNSYFLDTIL